MKDTKDFDELKFFAEVKKRPGMYCGVSSLRSLRDYISGMEYAFSFSFDESPLRYFNAFINRYQTETIKDTNGYACWWNHLLYICGNDDREAFDRFFVLFERYLHDAYQASLPTVTKKMK